jgi:hypothetical protein
VEYASLYLNGIGRLRWLQGKKKSGKRDNSQVLTGNVPELDTSRPGRYDELEGPERRAEQACAIVRISFSSITTRLFVVD